MTTTNFNFSSSLTPFSGIWTKQTFASRNYVNYDTHVGSPYIDLLVTGTQCALTCFVSTAAAFVFTVDGTPANSNVTTTNAWTTTNIFTGLADTQHTVRIALNGTPTTASIDLGTGGAGGPMLAVTGAAPALAAPTTNGTKYSFTTPQGQDITAFSTSGCVEGGAATSNANFNTTVLKGQTIRFASNCTSISLWCAGVTDSNSAVSAPRIALYQDGVQVGADTTGSTSGGYLTIGSGLDGNLHEYEILCSAGTQFNISYVSLGGGILAATPHVSHPIIAWYGDSITEGYAITDVRNNDAWIASRALGCYPCIRGVNGTTTFTYGRDNTATITSVSPAPSIVLVRYIHNDVGTGVSLANFVAAYITMITKIRAGIPNARIFCESCFPTTAVGTVAPLAQYNAQIYNAIQGMPGVFYMATDSWLNATTGTADGTHPNVAGYATMAAGEIGAIPIRFNKAQGSRVGTRSGQGS